MLSQRLIDHFLAQLDSDAVQTARKVFERTLEEQRAQALSQVSVLAEDTRIRSTAMMANLDEATVRDVLKDLMATSGAGLMAVLDVNGKVRAVTGVEGLRDVDLGSSTVVKAALQRPSAYIWTFPQQVLAVGVAPIRTQDQVNAFLVMGFEAAKTTLTAIHGSLGVSAAVLLGDKLVVSGTDDAAALEAMRAAAGNEVDKDVVVSGGDQPFFTRVEPRRRVGRRRQGGVGHPATPRGAADLSVEARDLDAVAGGCVDSGADNGCLSKRRKGIVTKLKWCTTRVSLGKYMVGAAAATVIADAGPIARAQEGEHPRSRSCGKQVRQLEAQVQTLRAAINDSIDVEPAADRQPEPRAERPGPGAERGGPPSPRAEAATDNVRPPPSLPKLAPDARVAAGGDAREAAGAAAAATRSPTGAIRGRVEVPGGEPVAYVYVENVFEPAVHGHKEVIQQKQKQFVPRWAVVQRGTTIEFPNNDNIYHNVFSLSSGNSFDLGLYNSSSEAKSQTFNEPGAVDIYCNIHPQMVASTLVVPNRYFAKVKSDGTYELAGVPSGKRKIVAWAPGSHLTVAVGPGRRRRRRGAESEAGVQVGGSQEQERPRLRLLRE